MGKTHEAQSPHAARTELFDNEMRRTSDDVRNLDRRDNPAQRWLRSSKGDASVRSSPRLAESAAIRAIVLLGEAASVFSLIETATGSRS